MMNAFPTVPLRAPRAGADLSATSSRRRFGRLRPGTAAGFPALALMALMAVLLAAPPPAWAGCASDDAACLRGELAELAAELNAVADGFRDRGNAGAERRWRSAALAVEGSDGGISLDDARRWLSEAERHGWGTGKRMLPRVIAAIEGLPGLVALEVRQALDGVQDGVPQDIVPGDGPQQQPPETANQQAVAFDGTIPVHSTGSIELFRTVTATLRVGNDGTFDGSGRVNYQTTPFPSFCLDPAKGCAEEPANADGWIVRKGRTGRAFTRSYTTTVTYEWSDGHRCTLGVDCDQGQRYYVKTGPSGNGPLVYIGRQYSLHPYWDDFRKKNPYGWSQNIHEIFDSQGNNIRKGGGLIPFNKAGAPYRVARHYTRAETITPGEHARTIVAARRNGENDYASFGVWLDEGYFARSSDGYAVRSDFAEAGVFAGGTNPATDVSGVAGTATYRGEAVGAVKWRDESNVNRRSTYDGAPVTLTADFDRMTMDTAIGLANRIHEPPGCTAASCLQSWRDRGPERIRFYDSRINADGSFGGFHAVQADPEFRPHPDHDRRLHTIVEPDDSASSLDGRFHVPDGDNAPGQALGTFIVKSLPEGSGRYTVAGAFGAVKD